LHSSTNEFFHIFAAASSTATIAAMKQRPLLSFFVLTFGITWGLGACFGLFPNQMKALFGPVSISNPLFILAVYAPSISAIIMTGLLDGPAGIRRLLARLVQWRNGLRWYLAILLGLPMLTAIALLSAAAVTRTPLVIDYWYQLFLLGPSGRDIIASLNSTSGGHFGVIGVVLASLLLDPGPLGEELGWRGFALPRLLEGRSALSAAVILGVIWGVWHLPAFIIAGTPQASISLPVFLIAIVAASVLMTWVFNGTRGSVLMAVLFHWTINTCSDLSHMPLAIFTAGAVVIAAIIVTFVGGPTHLSRSPEFGPIVVDKRARA
jgi:membrane protease YdiL (CAAX protease family)